MPLSRRRSLLILLSSGLCLLGRPAAAAAPVELAGERFDATMPVGGSSLLLNGVGLRAVAWFKGYAAALYLQARASTPEQVLQTPGPKRLQLRLLLDVPADEFAKAVDKGIARNTPEAQWPALAERRQRFDAAVRAVGEVKKGDVVNLDFVPGSGMLFTLNGQARSAPFAGEDFYAAVLRIFIGDKPVDSQLKAGLLGGPAS